jgi:hypothetical protein
MQDAYWFFTEDEERVKERKEIVGIFLVGITLLFLIIFAIKIFFVVKVVWLIFAGVFAISVLASKTILKIKL